MAKVAFASTAVAILLAAAWVTAGAALASDRELRAILDRLACGPERVMANRLSSTLVVYDVTCRQSRRVVQVECIKTDCLLLISARDDNER